MRFLFLLLSAFMMAACANTEHRTPSGSPEVTILGVRPEQVKPALVNLALNKRLRIKSDSPYLLVVEKETQNIAASILLASRYDTSVIERTSFSVAEVPGGTRVVADSTFITNSGSAFERPSIGRAALNTPELQAFLDELAAGFRSQAPPGPRAGSR